MGKGERSLNHNHGKNWTADDERRLIFNAARYTAEDLAELLGRNKNSVYCKIWMLRHQCGLQINTGPKPKTGQQLVPLKSLLIYEHDKNTERMMYLATRKRA